MNRLRSLLDRIIEAPLLGWIVLGLILVVAFNHEPKECWKLPAEDYARCMDLAAENPGSPW